VAYLYSRFLISIFEGFLRVGKLTLDMGCGKEGLGVIVKTVPENLKPLIIGVDLELSMLKSARLFYNDVVLASANYLPLRDKVFDAVLVIKVTEHLSGI